MEIANYPELPEDLEFARAAAATAFLGEDAGKAKARRMAFDDLECEGAVTFLGGEGLLSLWWIDEQPLIVYMRAVGEGDPETKVWNIENDETLLFYREG